MSDGEPAGPDGGVPAKDMESSSSQTKVFDDVEDLTRLVLIPDRRFLRNDEVDVDVGMDEVTVCGSADRAFDPHEAVFFRPLEHALCVQRILRQVSRIPDVRLDPADILTPPESPLLQTAVTR